MIVAAIEGPDLIIVLAIVLLLFGGAKLPQLARSLGQAKHEFEKGVGEGIRPASSAAGPTTEESDPGATASSPPPSD